MFWKLLAVVVVFANNFHNTVKPVQTTTSIRRPLVSPPKQIPIQLLLYKMTTCVTWPVATYFVPQMKKKKKLSKKPPQNFTQWKTLLLLYNVVWLKFIKAVHLYLTYVFPIIVVMKALDYKSRGPELKTIGRLQVQLILSSIWDWLYEYQELLGAEWQKVKLPPRIGFVALGQLNPIHKKGP